VAGECAAVLGAPVNLVGPVQPHVFGVPGYAELPSRAAQLDDGIEVSLQVLGYWSEFVVNKCEHAGSVDPMLDRSRPEPVSNVQQLACCAVDAELVTRHRF
jgi:hypothetical protein